MDKTEHSALAALLDLLRSHDAARCVRMRLAANGGAGATADVGEVGSQP
ncbi:MAG: hypothetical protein ABI968_08230 [Acidobacteriota bacterium]